MTAAAPLLPGNHTTSSNSLGRHGAGGDQQDDSTRIPSPPGDIQRSLPMMVTSMLRQPGAVAMHPVPMRGDEGFGPDDYNHNFGRVTDHDDDANNSNNIHNNEELHQVHATMVEEQDEEAQLASMEGELRKRILNEAVKASVVEPNTSSRDDINMMWNICSTVGLVFVLLGTLAGISMVIYKSVS